MQDTPFLLFQYLDFAEIVSGHIKRHKDKINQLNRDMVKNLFLGSGILFFLISWDIYKFWITEIIILLFLVVSILGFYFSKNKLKKAIKEEQKLMPVFIETIDVMINMIESSDKEKNTLMLSLAKKRFANIDFS